MLHRARRALLAIPLLATLAAGPAFAASTDDEGVDFTKEAKALFAVAACDHPENGYDFGPYDKKVVDAHCKKLGPIFEPYEQAWLAVARPFFDKLVPKDVPKTVVYPFGGADLLTVLAIFPDLQELTSLSLEAGGDPRNLAHLDSKKLKRSLELHRRFLDKLVTVNHSRTLDLGQLKLDPLPSQVVFALVGLHVHGYEPVRLRYFRVEADGSLHYLTAADIAEGDAGVSKARGHKKYLRSAELFGNFELVFKKQGGGPEQVYRHISANLDDEHLAADPRVLKHLEKKGMVTAMTKAASYLLWWHNFDTIRGYLLGHLVWMVSDSTGIPPNFLDANVFEIETYGKFRATAIKGSKEGEAAYRKAWEEQPQRELPFMFGYPSKAQHAHLVVTRRK
ncbi:MAG: hypothetical protein EP329_23245 [Deltaproteobacteria bacterium]|nr:MAG: hypothetical protein EP329_23245 [Deltaproteobacteria bacterium]